MAVKDMHSVYPISWILKSVFFIDFVNSSLKLENGEIIVADFASGEHDRVPSFFIDLLPKQLEIGSEKSSQIFVYSIDLHSLRLDSLLGKLEECNQLRRARMVQAKLESLDEKATIRPGVIQYLERHLDDIIWLDDFLIGERRFPPECIDIGVLNNDVIGYLHEYYKNSSNLNLAVQQIWKVIRPGGLLVVTMPCSLYVVDNIAVLERAGFAFEQGIDITLANGNVRFIEKNTGMQELSQLGHYTFFLLSKRKT
jgi:SAM-dependent methyltransferase